MLILLDNDLKTDIRRKCGIIRKKKYIYNYMIHIYKLFNSSKTYIGSTGNPLSVRLAQHILSHHSFKTGNNTKCVSSYDIIDEGSFEIELLETCNLEERFKREQYWMDSIPNINKNSAYTGIIGNQKTKESWAFYQRMHYIKNRADHIARKIRYYNQNKEKIKQKYNIVKLFQKLPFYSS
jgi:hypothetical protein